jgi:hypothetical protein
MTNTTPDLSIYELTERRLGVLREIATGASTASFHRQDISGLVELIDRLTAKAAEADGDRNRAEALAVRSVRALAQAQVETKGLRKALEPFAAIAELFAHKAGLRSTNGEIMTWTDDRALTVEHLLEAQNALNAPMYAAEPIEARYTNYKGETAIRRFIPYRVYLGANEWHPEQQVLIDALDCDKGKVRTFAASGFATASEPA